MMTEGEVRRLQPDDLDRVSEIDAGHSGGSRRGYFEKRLAAALRDPARHLQLGIDGEDGLVGYVLARVLSGEYGQDEDSVLLETIGVQPSAGGRGVATRLLERLEEETRGLSIGNLETTIEWRDYALVRFFAHHGFTKAPRHVLSCPVGRADRF